MWAEGLFRCTWEQISVLCGLLFLNKPYSSSGGRFTGTGQIKITVVGYLAAGAYGCL